MMAAVQDQPVGSVSDTQRWESYIIMTTGRNDFLNILNILYMHKGARNTQTESPRNRRALLPSDRDWSS